MKNEKLEIKKLGKVKFGSSKLYTKPSGYTLYNKDLGYLAFKFDNINEKVKEPYNPIGGRKALKFILESGISLDDNIEWIKPFN